MIAFPLGFSPMLCRPRRRRGQVLGRHRAAPATMLAGLIEFWPLCENLNTSRFGAYRRIEATVPYGFTIAQTAGVPGSRGLATSFASSGIVRGSSDGIFTMGDTDYTACCWARRDDATNSPVPFGVQKDGDTYAFWQLQLGPTNFLFYTSPNGSNSYYVQTSPNGATQGTWYFLVGRHDSVGNTLSISVSNGLYTASIAYTLGGRPSPALGYPYIGARPSVTGRLDSVQFAGIWNRLLSADEEAWLWNGGIGRHYPFV